MLPVIVFIGFVLFALLIVVFVFLKTMKRKLSHAVAREIEVMISAALGHADPRIQILELDKALDAFLGALGYRGTLGQKLVKASKHHFPHIEGLWRGHKLRNVLAHEPGASASVRDVEDMRNALHSSLQQVTSHK